MRRVFIWGTGVVCAALLTACGSGDVYSGEADSFFTAESLAGQVLTGEFGEGEAASEVSDAIEAAVQEADEVEYDTAMYTIRQPDGANLFIQQTGLVTDEDAMMYAFECTFRVTDAGTGEELQSISFRSSYKSPMAETSEPFADLNFDGYPDLSFVTYHAHNDNTLTYLWHPDTRRFEEAELFGDAGSYVGNERMKQISFHIHDSAAAGTDDVYRFADPYTTQLVWTLDYTYDDYHTDAGNDGHFTLYWYPDGEEEIFIDDAVLVERDADGGNLNEASAYRTDLYWKIFGSKITDSVPVNGGIIYHSYYIYPESIDPEGRRHHYVFMVTGDQHLKAWAEMEGDKDVSGVEAVEEASKAGTGGGAAVKLVYGDGTTDILNLVELD